MAIPDERHTTGSDKLARRGIVELRGAEPPEVLMMPTGEQYSAVIEQRRGPAGEVWRCIGGSPSSGYIDPAVGRPLPPPEAIDGP